MKKFKDHLIPLVITLIILYPKFPLFGVSSTFVSIRLEDILIGLIITIYGFSLIRSRFAQLKKPIPRSIILFWVIGLAASFSGIFLSKTAQPSLGALHTLRRVEYMSLFLVAYDWLSSLSQLKYYIRTIILVSLLVALYGLGQQFLRFPIISTNNSEFSKGLALTLGAGARINSTFAGHYDLAAFCVLPLLLIISLFPLSKQKLLLIVIGGLIYWTLLLSASRITFAAFFLSSALMLVLMRKKVWIGALVAVSIFGVLISPQLRGRYLDLITTHFKLSMVTSVHAQSLYATPSSKAVDMPPDVLKPNNVVEDRSLNIRLNVEWPRAVRAFLKNPLIGSGYSSIGLAADNEYLRILAETGLLGLASFALIIARLFKTSYSYVRNYKQDIRHAFILSSGCFVVSLLLGAMFIDVFTASKIAMVSWAIMGMAEKAKEIPS